MNDFSQRYAVVRYADEIEETRVARSTLRHTAMRHGQSQLNPVNAVLSCIPRILFGLQRAFGMARRSPQMTVPEPVPVQAPRYIVRGEEISAPNLRLVS